MSLSPDTKGGFSLGLPGAGHSFTSACRLMTSDPKEARFSGQVPPVIPGAKRFPVGRDRLGGITGKPPLGYMCHVRDSSTGCDARAQNRMQRCELG
jgi:hypothetical protein